jgi:predicted Zn-dependent protease
VGARVDRSGGLAGVASNVAVNAGADLLALKFSRNQELEADRLTVDWMIRAGYNPRGMLRLQERLGVLQQGKRKLAILSTHPGSAKRSKAAEKEIAKLTPPQELLARTTLPLVGEQALARATQSANKAQLDAALAEFADRQAAALAPAPPASPAADVHIGDNVSLGEHVHLGEHADR